MTNELSTFAEPIPYDYTPEILGLARLITLYEKNPDAVTLDDVSDALEAALSVTPGTDMDKLLLVQSRVLDFAFNYLVESSIKNFGDEQTDQSFDLSKLHAGFRAQRQYRESYAALANTFEKNSTTNKLIKQE